jgi:hypothetical protein
MLESLNFVKVSVIVNNSIFRIDPLMQRKKCSQMILFEIGDYSIAYVDGIVTLPSVAAQQNSIISQTPSTSDHMDVCNIGGCHYAEE